MQAASLLHKRLCMYTGPLLGAEVQLEFEATSTSLHCRTGVCGVSRGHADSPQP